MSATEGRRQPLISQWVRRPLGTRSSLVVNTNGINIKKKSGSLISKVDKNVISTVVQNENIDISKLCNIVKVSPRKVVLNTSSQNIHSDTISKSNPTGATSFSSQVLKQVTDVDSNDACLPLLVSEYVQDIYRHLWYLETQHRVPKGFLQDQKVSPWMRATVIDWLIQLQVRFTK